MIVTGDGSLSHSDFWRYGFYQVRYEVVSSVLEEIISEMSELVIPERKGIVYQIKE